MHYAQRENRYTRARATLPTACPAAADADQRGREGKRHQRLLPEPVPAHPVPGPPRLLADRARVLQAAGRVRERTSLKSEATKRPSEGREGAVGRARDSAPNEGEECIRFFRAGDERCRARGGRAPSHARVTNGRARGEGEECVYDFFARATKGAERVTGGVTNGRARGEGEECIYDFFARATKGQSE